MRNLFLLLLFANLLLLAWQLWVDPGEPAAAVAPAVPELTLYGLAQESTSAARLADDTGSPQIRTAASEAGGDAACQRVGPLASADDAAELASSLVDRGLSAATVLREGRVWVGQGVTVGGFRTAADAAAARRRLHAGGLTDALVVQAEGRPVVSLGVFRERVRADRVMTEARRLGFRPSRADRYRPGSEHWVVIRLPAGEQAPALSGPGTRVLRREPASCSALEPAARAATGVSATP